MLVVQHQEHAAPGQLETTLKCSGLELALWRADAERELRLDPKRFAGVVVLGGGMDATDTTTYPHLEDTRSLIASAADQNVPVLGLCLGAQLAALALGGRVSRRPDGFCIGWLPTRRANDDPITASLTRGARLLHWHQDQFHLPPRAVVLLNRSDGFRLGSVTAIQAHPEVTPELADRWLARKSAPARLAQVGLTPKHILEGFLQNQRYGRALLEAWAREVNQLSRLRRRP